MPYNADVDYQQKLLSMYRSLLAEYLRQRELWDRTEIPDFLRTGISAIRRQIADVKGRLRGWKIVVDDHPDDEGPDDNLAGEVAHHRNLLKIHRTNLELALRQQELFGERDIPPRVIYTLQNARSEIQKIKAILRAWNIAVEDLDGEEPV